MSVRLDAKKDEQALKGILLNISSFQTKKCWNKVDNKIQDAFKSIIFYVGGLSPLKA